MSEVSKSEVGACDNGAPTDRQQPTGIPTIETSDLQKHAPLELREMHDGIGRQGLDDVLDVDGARRLLQVGRNTVYTLVARNQIPHRRVGKQIRFSRAAIMRWFSSWSSQVAKKRQ